jgi:hypothetical protein
MIRKIGFRTAVNTLLILFAGVSFFHILVLLQVIPYTIVWGGGLSSVSQMYQFEGIALVTILLVMLVVSMKGNYIKPFLPKVILNFLLGLFAVLFFLNTIGNLMAETSIETVIFSPITLISAVLCLRLIIER